MKKQILIGVVITSFVLALMSLFNFHMHNSTILDVMYIQAIITGIFLCFDFSKLILKYTDCRDKQEFNMIAFIICLCLVCIFIGLFKDYESLRTISVYSMPTVLLLINNNNRYLLITLLLLALFIPVW